jgi:Flp pilus assembly protein TadG
MNKTLKIGSALALVLCAAVALAALQFNGSTAGTVTCTNNTASAINGPVIDVQRYDEIAVGIVVSGDYTGAESSTNWIDWALVNPSTASTSARQAHVQLRTTPAFL